MNSEKKLTLKRLAIFLVISFLPFMILIPVENRCIQAKTNIFPLLLISLVFSE